MATEPTPRQLSLWRAANAAAERGDLILALLLLQEAKAKP